MMVQRELFSVSDKILYSLLYTIKKSGGKISGKTKLIKLLFLFESEGMIHFDYPIRQHIYGPYRDNEYNHALSNGLIQEERAKVLDYPCIEIRLTEAGIEKLSKFGSVFKKREIQKIEKIIERYSHYSSSQLKEYVYEKYLDKFKVKDVEDFIQAISEILPIANRKLEYALKEDDKKTIHKQIKLVGYLDHIKRILNDIEEKEIDKTERSVILNAIKELIELLKSKNFSMEDNPDSEEICDFIDNYADVHSITKSVSASDFSEFSKEEKGCIAKILEKY